MIQKAVFKRIHRLERRYIPNLKYNRIYKKVSRVVLIPLALITYALDLALTFKKRRVPTKAKSINLKNIVDGFANLAFPNEQVEKIAVARAEVCAECPSAVKTGIYSVVVDNRTKHIQGMKCSECGCNLSAKVRSANDTCPLGKW